MANEFEAEFKVEGSHIKVFWHDTEGGWYAEILKEGERKPYYTNTKGSGDALFNEILGELKFKQSKDQAVLIEELLEESFEYYGLFELDLANYDMEFDDDFIGDQDMYGGEYDEDGRFDY